MKRKTTQKWFSLLFVLNIFTENRKELKRLFNKSTTTKTTLIVDILGKPPENQLISFINNHTFLKFGYDSE